MVFFSFLKYILLKIYFKKAKKEETTKTWGTKPRKAGPPLPPFFSSSFGFLFEKRNASLPIKKLLSFVFVMLLPHRQIIETISQKRREIVNINIIFDKSNRRTSWDKAREGDR
jgi:hypothetical protein